MNKKFLIAIALFAISINFTQIYKEKLLYPIHFFNINYLKIKEYFSLYINQAEKIKRLQSRNLELEKIGNYLKFYQNNLADFKKLKIFQNYNFKYKSYLVKPLSYLSFGNYSQIWIHFKEFNKTQNKIYGLVKFGKTIGIVSQKMGFPYAILNSDPTCSYAVSIGKNSVAGIIKGERNGFMKVEFIPNWLKININDEVVTSGLDSIFIKGIKVGKIISIQNNGLYQIAKVKPYNNQVIYNYFFAIDIK